MIWVFIVVYSNLRLNSTQGKAFYTPPKNKTRQRCSARQREYGGVVKSCINSRKYGLISAWADIAGLLLLHDSRSPAYCTKNENSRSSDLSRFSAPSRLWASGRLRKTLLNRLKKAIDKRGNTAAGTVTESHRVPFQALANATLCTPGTISATKICVIYGIAKKTLKKE